MGSRWKGFVALWMVLFLPMPCVFAEEKPLWEVGVGAALLQMPDYRGSNEERLYCLPYPYVVYRGDILKVDENRVTGRISRRIGLCWISACSDPYR